MIRYTFETLVEEEENDAFNETIYLHFINLGWMVSEDIWESKQS